MPPPSYSYKYRIYNKTQTADAPSPGRSGSHSNLNLDAARATRRQQQQQQHHERQQRQRLNRSFDVADGAMYGDDFGDYHIPASSSRTNVNGPVYDGLPLYDGMDAVSRRNLEANLLAGYDDLKMNRSTINISSNSDVNRAAAFNGNNSILRGSHSFHTKNDLKNRKLSSKSLSTTKIDHSLDSSFHDDSFKSFSFRDGKMITNSVGEGSPMTNGFGQSRRSRPAERGVRIRSPEVSLSPPRRAGGMSLDRRQFPQSRSFNKLHHARFRDSGSVSPSRFGRSLSNEALNKNQSSVRSAGMSSQTPSTMSSTMRDMLNRSQEQVPLDGVLSLDVVYITERIISMTFPSVGHDTTYAFNLKEVVRMLQTKHGDNYLVLNLSEKRQDLTKANPQVKDYGWPDHMAPPLERLCSLCKSIDSWLNADVRNVVVLHCKGGRSRIASVIAAFMHYSNICASADQALDRFAMKRFYDDKLGGLPLPSQRRYVRYFSGLLSGAIKINSQPLYLHHILIHGVPNFDTRGGCRPFIKVYQGMQPIFTSGVYNVTDNMQKVCISISPGIPLRGDILIKCYHKKTRSGQREVIWQCQFHTCAISNNSLVFSKQELDDAIMDPRFPDNGKVEFVFGPSSDILVSVSGFKSDVTVPVDDNEDNLARSDSYENFHRTLESLEALDLNKNGIPSAARPSGPPQPSQHHQPQQQQPPLSRLHHHHQQQQQQAAAHPRPVEHSKSPDGSLYAVVNKRELHQHLHRQPPQQTPPPSYSSLSSQPFSSVTPQHRQYPPPASGAANVSGLGGAAAHTYRGPPSSHLTNGSLTSSLDSGFSAQNANFSTHYTASATTSNNISNSHHISGSTSSGISNAKGDFISPTATSPTQHASGPPRSQRHQTVEERTQLDELLSDLLSEQAYITPSQPSPQSFSTAVQSQQAPPPSQQHAPISPDDLNGTSNTPAMSAAKTITTTTRTFTSYSSTDSVRNPDRVLIQRAEVTYKVPGQGEVKDHYTIAADPNQMLEAPASQSKQPANQYSPKVPQNAFSYTTGVSSSSSSQRTQQRAEVVEHEIIRNPVNSNLQSPPSSRLPYRPDYTGDGPLSPTSGSYQYSSLDSDTDSWLQQQQQKLKNFKEGRDSTGRTEQEKKLVNELKFAQNKYYTRRTQSEEEERDMMDAYNRQTLQSVQNGPNSLDHVTPTYSTPHRSVPNSLDNPWPGQPDSQHQYSSSYSSSYLENRSYGDKRSNKPPPSPTMPRSITPTASAPAPIPTRSSSKEYMRARSNSSSSTWQQQQQQQYQPHRPLQRQASDTLFDRNREVEHIAPKTYGSTYTTPPLSPRAISPSPGPTSTTTYTQYRTIQREAPPPQPQPQPPPPPPPQQINHHYITEVYVHRQDKDKVDSTRLEELEKNLEAATKSIKAAQQHQPVQHQPVQHQPVQQQPVQQQPMQQQPLQQQHRPPQHHQPPQNQMPPSQIMEEMVRSHVESRQFQQFAESKPESPPRPKVKEVEEDRIMLRPIGPGMQTLEPESVHTGTLGRPTTPGFPSTASAPDLPIPSIQIDDATPPFPVTPKTPYQNSVTLTPASSVFLDDPSSFSPYHGPGGGSPLPSQTPPPRQGSRSYSFRGWEYDPTYATIPEDRVLAVGGSQILHPGVPIQPQQQTIQYQQFHQSQQYSTQTQHDGGPGHGPNSLHIDTSPKMLSPRSPSSPPSPGNLNTLRQQLNSAHSMSNSVVSPGPHSMTGQSSPSVYFGLSRRGSLSSLADSDMVHTTPKFIKDTSKFWYKPHISREEAIQMLREKAPGTFVIRDSNSFPGAFGLALKVASIPANVQAKPSGDPLADLVRHFLIEPTPKGVRLRGCSNEPVFGSLAALVYQHSITPLALPCKLALPECDVIDGFTSPESPLGTSEINSAATLLAQGAACNVVFINSVDMESLTGPQAVAKAIKMTFDHVPREKTTMVHFKVAAQGITLTDNNRQLFFRRHYPVTAVTYCGMDPQDRRWKREANAPGGQGDARIFGFVARKSGSPNENSCHIFAELDPEQPASAIVNFVTKIMIGQSGIKS